MKKINSDWTYQEFLAFLLLYAAHADLELKEEEKEKIMTKVNKAQFNEILKEFRSLSDFDCLQKILNYKEQHINKEKKINQVLEDVKDLFQSDDKYSIAEKAMMGLLRKLFKVP